MYSRASPQKKSDFFGGRGGLVDLLLTAFFSLQHKKQTLYVKDTTDYLNFIEKTKLPKSAIYDSNDVTSLYLNIPQDGGIATVCEAYEEFYQKKTTNS